jgi:hypothetical protein
MTKKDADITQVTLDLMLVLGRATRAITRVLKLHEKVSDPGVTPFCRYCEDDYPCRTVQELMGEEYKDRDVSPEDAAAQLREANTIVPPPPVKPKQTRPNSKERKISDYKMYPPYDAKPKRRYDHRSGDDRWLS